MRQPRIAAVKIVRVLEEPNIDCILRSTGLVCMLLEVIFFIPQTHVLLYTSACTFNIAQNMCCNLAESVGSWEHKLHKKCISFVFYFENLSIAVTLEPLVRFRWGFQQNVPLLIRILIKQKTEMSHVGLSD